MLLAGCGQVPATKPKPVVADFERDSATQVFIDPARVPELRKTATKSCLCERTNPRKDEAECWSDFWKVANEYKSSGEWASACGPGSTSGIDFARAATVKGNPDMTIMTEWGYGACSAEEVETKKAEYERKSKARGC